MQLSFRTEDCIGQALGTIPQDPQQNKLLGAPFIVLSGGYRSGLRFGANTSLYKSSFLAYHSEILLFDIGRKPRSTDLTSCLRVAKNVKKTCVLEVDMSNKTFLKLIRLL